MRRDNPVRGDLQLYLTGEHDCSYIDGLQARTLFVDPLARIDGERAQWLQQIGFRRSGQHFYRPACRGCQRCVPVRVPVAEFVPNRSQRRNLQRNATDLELQYRSAELDPEHYALYERYLLQRHGDGDMADDVSVETYMRFLLAPWGGDTRFIEMRRDDACSASPSPMSSATDCRRSTPSSIRTMPSVPSGPTPCSARFRRQSAWACAISTSVTGSARAGRCATRRSSDPSRPGTAGVGDRFERGEEILCLTEPLRTAALRKSPQIPARPDRDCEPLRDPWERFAIARAAIMDVDTASSRLQAAPDKSAGAICSGDSSGHGCSRGPIAAASRSHKSVGAI